MANTLVTPTIFARAAVVLLENELQMARRVYRDYETDFSKSVNGYKVGQTINIRKPAQFTYRSGRVASSQDISEGYTTIAVDQQGGVDFEMTSVEKTMNISDLSARVIKPAMIQIADKIDRDLMGLVFKTWNWVGTSGSAVNSLAKVMAGVRRMNEMSFPKGNRHFALSPADHEALVSAQSGLYVERLAGEAYREGDMGNIAGLDTFWSQNVPTLTAGTRTTPAAVNGAAQQVTYTGAQMNTYTQSLAVDGLGVSTTIKAGEVFTIAGVYAVNPVSKTKLSFLQQFVVTADATATAGGAATLTISPAIIVSGAFQSVDAAPADNAVVTFKQAASAIDTSSFAFHKNAFALAMVPLEKPEGAVNVGTASHRGITVRVVPYYDGTNDVNKWRLDVLYGFSAIDPRLAVRVNG